MSPLRYYTGGVPRTQNVVWHCPTCKTENTGLLEDGCPHCRAGADATRTAEVPRLTSPVDGVAASARQVPPPTPFEVWWSQADLGNVPMREIARRAFEAGRQWSLLGAVEVPPVPPTAPVVSQGDVVLATYQPETLTVTQLDARTVTTIQAALRFYQENLLAFAAVDGQLTTSEVDTLLSSMKDPYGTNADADTTRESSSSILTPTYSSRDPNYGSGGTSPLF